MLEIINTRHSVRAFRDVSVDRKVIMEILECGMNAPSAGGEEAWAFIVLGGEQLRRYEQINRNVPKGAPCGILVCADKTKEKYPGYSLYDCCAAVENMLLAVHAKGLGAVWTAVFPDAVPEIKKLCLLPDKVDPIAFIPIGQPKKEAASRSSRYKESNVHWDTW
jgi:nitroreductase